VKGCEGVKGNITENTLIGFENINVTKTPIDVKSLFGVDEWVTSFIGANIVQEDDLTPCPTTIIIIKIYTIIPTRLL